MCHCRFKKGGGLLPKALHRPLHASTGATDGRRYEAPGITPRVAPQARSTARIVCIRAFTRHGVPAAAAAATAVDEPTLWPNRLLATCGQQRRHAGPSAWRAAHVRAPPQLQRVSQRLACAAEWRGGSDSRPTTSARRSPKRTDNHTILGRGELKATASGAGLEASVLRCCCCCGGCWDGAVVSLSREVRWRAVLRPLRRCAASPLPHWAEPPTADMQSLSARTMGGLHAELY